MKKLSAWSRTKTGMLYLGCFDLLVLILVWISAILSVPSEHRETPAIWISTLMVYAVTLLFRNMVAQHKRLSETP